MPCAAPCTFVQHTAHEIAERDLTWINPRLGLSVASGSGPARRKAGIQVRRGKRIGKEWAIAPLARNWRVEWICRNIRAPLSAALASRQQEMRIPCQGRAKLCVLPSLVATL